MRFSTTGSLLGQGTEQNHLIMKTSTLEKQTWSGLDELNKT